MILESQYQNFYTAQNVISSFIFLPRMLILDTMIAYCVQITTKLQIRNTILESNANITYSYKLSTMCNVISLLFFVIKGVECMFSKIMSYCVEKVKVRSRSLLYPKSQGSMSNTF